MRNLEWPSVAHISSWRLSPKAHTRGAASPEGAGTWALGSGAHIVGELSVAAMTHADALTVRAFLHRLRGRAGSFLLGVPGTEQSGTAAAYDDGTLHTDHTGYTDYGFTSYGAATCTGAIAADASAVTLSSISESALLVPGGYMTIGDVTSTGQLVQIVSVSGSDVTFRPRLRTAQSAGAAIRFGYVYGLFRLAEDTPRVSIMPAHCPGLSFPIEEFR